MDARKKPVWKAVRMLRAIGMRMALVGALCVAIVSGCDQKTTGTPSVSATHPGGPGGEPSINSPAEQPTEPAGGTLSSPPAVEVPAKEVNGKPYVALRSLARQVGGTVTHDAVEGTIEAVIAGYRFSWIVGTPVLARDGVFLPGDFTPVVQGHEIWVPMAFVRDGLRWSDQPAAGGHVRLTTSGDATTETGTDTARPVLARMRASDIAAYLKGLDVPIRAAHLSSRDSHLPGAPRAYRSGIHEGIDWYGGYTGVTITRSTPVVAAADGVVVRADRTYREMTKTERDRLLAECRRLGHTPAYILDRLRGRTVWVQHDSGLLTRYAHLSGVADGIDVGVRVKRGQVLGYVGNSGTSSGVAGTDNDLHLHLDILVYGEPFWQYLKPEEIRAVLEAVFSPAVR